MTGGMAIDSGLSDRGHYNMGAKGGGCRDLGRDRMICKMATVWRQSRSSSPKETASAGANDATRRSSGGSFWTNEYSLPDGCRWTVVISVTALTTQYSRTP